MKYYFFIFVLFFSCSRVDFAEVDATSEVSQQIETGQCQVDADCPQGGTCQMGACVKVDPYFDEDVVESDTSEKNADVSEQNDVEAEHGSDSVEYEDETSSEVETECDDNVDCDDDNACTKNVCEDGECVVSIVFVNCCNAHADCEAGEKCYENKCLEIPNFCESNEDCEDEEMVSKCDENSYTKLFNYIPFCNTAYGEGLGQCEFKKETVLCEITCQNDKCVECGMDKDCDDDDDCTNDLCNGNECYHISIKNCCNSEMDCNGYGEECVDNKCVLNLPSCEVDEDCDDNNLCSDDYCVDGGCFHITKMWCCQADQDCEKGSSCENNVCVADLDCDNNSDCNDDDDCTDDSCESGMCVYTPNGICTWECATDSHCQDSKYGTFCVYGTCQPCVTSEDGKGAGKGCGKDKCYWTLGLDPEGYEVPVNKCYEEECFVASDCPDKDPVCEDGLKKKFIPTCNVGVCEYDEKFVSCPDGEVCLDGECGACQKDEDCADNEVCTDGECVVKAVEEADVVCQINCYEPGYAPIMWVADQEFNKDEEVNPFEFEVELCAFCSWGAPKFHYNCKNGGSYGFGINAEVKCYNNGKAVEVDKDEMFQGKTEVTLPSVDCSPCW